MSRYTEFNARTGERITNGTEFGILHHRRGYAEKMVDCFALSWTTRTVLSLAGGAGNAGFDLDDFHRERDASYEDFPDGCRRCRMCSCRQRRTKRKEWRRKKEKEDSRIKARKKNTIKNPTFEIPLPRPVAPSLKDVFHGGFQFHHREQKYL